jgi:hypothetical protein
VDETWSIPIPATSGTHRFPAGKARARTIHHYFLSLSQVLFINQNQTTLMITDNFRRPKLQSSRSFLGLVVDPIPSQWFSFLKLIFHNLPKTSSRDHWLVPLERDSKSLCEAMVEWFRCEQCMVSSLGRKGQKEGYFQMVN